MLRLVLTLIAVVAVLALGACGGDDDEGSAPATATSQPDTGTDTDPSPAEAEKALKDTSTKPVIPQPTGTPPRKLVIEDIVKGKGPPAKRGSVVVVNYVGENFSNGQQFDASWDRGQTVPAEARQEQGDRGLDARAHGDPEGRPARCSPSHRSSATERRATRRRSRRTRRSCS